MSTSRRQRFSGSQILPIEESHPGARIHIIIVEQAGQIRTFTGHLIARDEHTIVLRLANPLVGEAPVVRLETDTIVLEEQAAA